jgi:hypothetical protein
VICGLFELLPLGYGVSNHCVKNVSSFVWHSGLWLCRAWWNSASSCGSVIVPPP